MAPISNLISEEDLKTIRLSASRSEKEGRLVPENLALIYQNKWFQIMEPKSCGGLEWPLPQTVRLFEALAWADANVGWCVNLGAGANMFSGYLEAPTASAIFNSEAICCAGSGAVGGTARKVKDGFIISGRWKYASGAAHATHFTANCFLADEDNRPLMKNGQQVFRSFIFPAKAVTLQNTWKVIGLKATSSDDFEVKDLFVPESCTFSLLGASCFAQGPLYKFPFGLLAVVNMACMPTGIALHFIDLFQELAATKRPLHAQGLLKDNQQVKMIFEKVTHDFYAAREEMYQALDEVWTCYEQVGSANDRLINQLRLSAKEAAEKARDTVNALFPLCGMDILYLDSALNKVWRDMATASQHYILSPLSK